MFRRKFKNGILSFFKSYAIREYDGKVIRKDDLVYDVFMAKPLGRIEMFIDHYGYIMAIIKGVKYDIDNIHYHE